MDGTGSRPQIESLELKALDYMPLDEVLVDNFIHVLAIDVGVPDRLGIHHHDRSFLAAIQTAGGIDAHPALPRDTERFAALLGVITHRLRIEALAAGAAILPEVGTEEDVMTVPGHGYTIPDPGTRLKAPAGTRCKDVLSSCA
jgi:hypothetical protein